MLWLVEQQRHALDVEFVHAGDEGEHGTGEPEVDRSLVPLLVIVAPAMEQLPGIGEIVPEIEQAPARARQSHALASRAANRSRSPPSREV
jgi:hypothetical protein